MHVLQFIPGAFWGLAIVDWPAVGWRQWSLWFLELPHLCHSIPQSPLAAYSFVLWREWLHFHLNLLMFWHSLVDWSSISPLTIFQTSFLEMNMQHWTLTSFKLYSLKQSNQAIQVNLLSWPINLHWVRQDGFVVANTSQIKSFKAIALDNLMHIVWFVSYWGQKSFNEVANIAQGFQFWGVITEYRTEVNPHWAMDQNIG